MRNLVDKIPVDIIKEIVDKDVIANAVPIAGNAYMKFLFVVWYNYIEPNGSGEEGCLYCLQHVKSNFQQLRDAIVERYREQQKLESL
jgi:hypothetical protein